MPGRISKRKSGSRRAYKRNYAGRKRARPPSKRRLYKRTSRRARSRQLVQISRAVRSNYKLIQGPARVQHLTQAWDVDVYKPHDTTLGAATVTNCNGAMWPLHWTDWQPEYPTAPDMVTVPQFFSYACLDSNKTALLDANKLYVSNMVIKGKITPADESALCDITLFLVQSTKKMMEPTNSHTFEVPGATHPGSLSPLLQREIDYTTASDGSCVLLNTNRWKVLRSKRVFTQGSSLGALPALGLPNAQYHAFSWYIPIRRTLEQGQGAFNTNNVVSYKAFNTNWLDLDPKLKYWVFALSNNDIGDNQSPRLVMNVTWKFTCWGGLSGPNIHPSEP